MLFNYGLLCYKINDLILFYKKIEILFYKNKIYTTKQSNNVIN